MCPPSSMAHALSTLIKVTLHVAIVNVVIVNMSSLVHMPHTSKIMAFQETTLHVGML